MKLAAKNGWRISFQQENKKRPGSDSWRRYEAYKTGSRIVPALYPRGLSSTSKYFRPRIRYDWSQRPQEPLRFRVHVVALRMISRDILAKVKYRLYQHCASSFRAERATKFPRDSLWLAVSTVSSILVRALTLTHTITKSVTLTLTPRPCVSRGHLITLCGGSYRHLQSSDSHQDCFPNSIALSPAQWLLFLVRELNFTITRSSARS
jgi:hypothetical protein